MKLTREPHTREVIEAPWRCAADLPMASASLHVLRYMHMRRTSILLDPGLLAELERIARRQGRPTAHVIREALEQRVAAEAAESRSLPGFVGLAQGPGAPDTDAGDAELENPT
jgi:Ribbon-helix-helix protein, copG family